MISVKHTPLNVIQTQDVFINSSTDVYVKKV